MQTTTPSAALAASSFGGGSVAPAPSALQPSGLEIRPARRLLGDEHGYELEIHAPSLEGAGIPFLLDRKDLRALQALVVEAVALASADEGVRQAAMGRLSASLRLPPWERRGAIRARWTPYGVEASAGIGGADARVSVSSRDPGAPVVKVSYRPKIGGIRPDWMDAGRHWEATSDLEGAAGFLSEIARHQDLTAHESLESAMLAMDVAETVLEDRS